VIFEKTLMTLAAAAAIAAAAAVGVFAAAFALHAMLQPFIGAAGAAAVVAAVAALIVAIAGLLAARKAEGRHASHNSGHAAPQDSFDFTSRIVDIVKDRPLLSIGAALAAGVFALKNPTLTAAVAKAFMETRQPPR
jgi:uncharacterized membrane protein YdfJ with MMPL/SSD domain